MGLPQPSWMSSDRYDRAVRQRESESEWERQRETERDRERDGEGPGTGKRGVHVEGRYTLPRSTTRTSPVSGGASLIEAVGLSFSLTAIHALYVAPLALCVARLL